MAPGKRTFKPNRIQQPAIRKIPTVGERHGKRKRNRQSSDCQHPPAMVLYSLGKNMLLHAGKRAYCMDHQLFRCQEPASAGTHRKKTDTGTVAKKNQLSFKHLA